jgi:hypothetical protein
MKKSTSDNLIQENAGMKIHFRIQGISSKCTGPFHGGSCCLNGSVSIDEFSIRQAWGEMHWQAILPADSQEVIPVVFLQR